jgi:predicted nucleic acid-binding protein
VICVDASVVLKCVFDEVRSTQARELFGHCERSGESVIAPTLLAFEVTNAVRQHIRRGDISVPEARRILGVALDLPVVMASHPSIHDEALALSSELGLRAAYDAHYVVLARFTGAQLWTDDVRLLDALPREYSFARWIGNYDVGER